MPRPKTILYWTPDTDVAIVEFINSQEQETRDRIYNDKLHAPFCKLVENIINRFKYDYVSLDYESLHNDVLGHLVRNIHHFKPEKGKGFGFCSIVVKNYLIQANQIAYKERCRHVPIVECDDKEEDDSSQSVTLSYSAPEFDTKDFVSHLADYWTKNISRMFPEREGQRIVARAVVRLFTDSPELPNIGRGQRAVYQTLRDQTGRNTQYIARVIRRMAGLYPKLLKKYIADGYLVKPKRNRDRKGDRNRQSKLTDAKVMAIRRMYAEGNLTQSELGRMYGVNDSVVSTIIRGKAWKHLLPEGFSSPHSYRWRGNRKLTEAQVLNIRQQAKDGIKEAALASMYGVSKAAVNNITAGRSWRHLPISLAFPDTRQLDNQSLSVSA